MTEKEAVRWIQDLASGERDGEVGALLRDVTALATLTLANRIHMQLLRGELADLREALESNDII